VETIRHKLEVLNQHRDTVGRDPAEITKTRFGALVMADTDAEAPGAGYIVSCAAITGEDSLCPTSTTARTSGMALTPDAPVKDGLRNVRYGEVLLLRSDNGAFSAEVWNTLGMNDCPQAEWEALDAAAIASERGAVVAILNGPRFWVLDFIKSNIREQAPETTFGTLGMFRAAVIAFGAEPPVQVPYTERSIVRETVFGFAKGSEIYELVTPDDTHYVMQAYSQIIDKSLAIGDLPGLGTRIEKPQGWAFRVRTLQEDLEMLSTDGVATVIQDELQNTYQRIDKG